MSREHRETGRLSPGQLSLLLGVLQGGLLASLLCYQLQWPVVIEAVAWVAAMLAGVVAGMIEVAAALIAMRLIDRFRGRRDAE